MSDLLTMYELQRDNVPFVPARETAALIAKAHDVNAEAIDRVRLCTAPSGWGVREYLDAILAQDNVLRSLDGEPVRKLLVSVDEWEDAE